MEGKSHCFYYIIINTHTHTHTACRTNDSSYVPTLYFWLSLIYHICHRVLFFGRGNLPLIILRPVDYNKAHLKYRSKYRGSEHLLLRTPIKFVCLDQENRTYKIIVANIPDKRRILVSILYRASTYINDKIKW